MNKLQKVVDGSKLCWSIAELAASAGVSKPFLREQITLGKLRVARVGRRVLIPAICVEEWLRLHMN